MKTENRFEIKFNMSNIELIKFKEKYRLINKMYPTRKNYIILLRYSQFKIFLQIN